MYVFIYLCKSASGYQVRVPVRPGDVLVLATDGLFDNMEEDDLLDVIEEGCSSDSPQVCWPFCLMSYAQCLGVKPIDFNKNQ